MIYMVNEIGALVLVHWIAYYTLFFSRSMLLRCSFMQICVHDRVRYSTSDDAICVTIELLSVAQDRISSRGAR